MPLRLWEKSCAPTGPSLLARTADDLYTNPIGILMFSTTTIAWMFNTLSLIWIVWIWTILYQPAWTSGPSNASCTARHRSILCALLNIILAPFGKRVVPVSTRLQSDHFRVLMRSSPRMPQRKIIIRATIHAFIINNHLLDTTNWYYLFLLIT